MKKGVKICDINFTAQKVQIRLEAERFMSAGQTRPAQHFSGGYPENQGGDDIPNKMLDLLSKL